MLHGFSPWRGPTTVSVAAHTGYRSWTSSTHRSTRSFGEKGRKPRLHKNFSWAVQSCAGKVFQMVSKSIEGLLGVISTLAPTWRHRPSPKAHRPPNLVIFSGQYSISLIKFSLSAEGPCEVTLGLCGSVHGSYCPSTPPGPSPDQPPTSIHKKFRRKRSKSAPPQEFLVDGAVACWKSFPNDPRVDSSGHKGDQYPCPNVHTPTGHLGS